MESTGFHADVDPSRADSPLEFELARELARHVSGTLSQQRPVETILGVFYLDMAISSGPLSIAIECDGKQFHDWKRDVVRDAAILETSSVSAIYRLPGTSVHHAPIDFLFLIAELYPSLFSVRGRTNLETQASDVALAYRHAGLVEASPNHILIPPNDNESDDRWERWSRSDLAGWRLASDGTWPELENLIRGIRTSRPVSVAHAQRVLVEEVSAVRDRPPYSEQFWGRWMDLCSSLEE